LIHRLESELQQLQTSVASKDDWVPSSEVNLLLSEKAKELEEKALEINQLNESLQGQLSQAHSLKEHNAQLEARLESTLSEHEK
jgi:hypothetical protein